MIEHRQLTERIIGLAIEVHRLLGPGLLESGYVAYLCQELKHAGLSFQRQVAVPVAYKGWNIPLGFRADIVAADAVILEVKAVPTPLPAHQAQLLSYLRMSQIRVGLLLKFPRPAPNRRSPSLYRLKT